MTGRGRRKGGREGGKENLLFQSPNVKKSLGRARLEPTAGNSIAFGQHMWVAMAPALGPTSAASQDTSAER